MANFDDLVRSRIRELTKERDKMSELAIKHEADMQYYYYKKKVMDLDEAIKSNQRILAQITGVH